MQGSRFVTLSRLPVCISGLVNTPHTLIYESSSCLLCVAANLQYGPLIKVTFLLYSRTYTQPSKGGYFYVFLKLDFTFVCSFFRFTTVQPVITYAVSNTSFFLEHFLFKKVYYSIFSDFKITLYPGGIKKYFFICDNKR